MRIALVQLNDGKSLFLFGAEFDFLQGLVRETHQVRRYRQRELTERDFGVRLVTQAAQNCINVLFQDLLLVFEQVVLDVFEV